MDQPQVKWLDPTPRSSYAEVSRALLVLAGMRLWVTEFVPPGPMAMHVSLMACTPSATYRGVTCPWLSDRVGRYFACEMATGRARRVAG